MNSFLNGIEFPTINKLSRDSLEENIQIEYIKESIASMKSGKAPGPDGFPLEFYKAQFYFSFFSESLQNGWLFACKSLSSNNFTALEERKESIRMWFISSYLSVKLWLWDLSQTFIYRLKNSVGQIISPDQTGFIRDRYSFSNVRCQYIIFFPFR